MNMPPQSQQVYKYPSMTSVNTLASLGYLPPGHGYVPKKEKPEKPYGLPFTTVMNRTHRGPGRKHLRYALAFFIAAILFFAGAALYLGHRNVSRMIVYRTEVLGAFMVVVGIICVYMMGRCIWTARAESNKWRYGVRFRPEGLTTAAAYNAAYLPEDVVGEKLMSGTYGPKALKEVPKPKRKPKSRARSKDNLDEVGLEKPRQRPAPPSSMDTLDEVDEAKMAPMEHISTIPPVGGPQQPLGPPRPQFRPGGPPPPGGYRPRGPPPPGWRGPPPPGFRPRGPPPPGWRPPPPGWRGPRPGGPGGIPPQPQRVPPTGPGPHPMQDIRGTAPAPYVTIGGVTTREAESDL